MLTEKRFEEILKLLDEKKSITVTEIKEMLNTSESTIRRDLTALDRAGKLVKVFGGAVAVDAAFTAAEPSVAQKVGVNKEEKQTIARYAASLLVPDDFIYLDAGTTTGYMIDYVTERSVTFVTNAVSHAQRLAMNPARTGSMKANAVPPMLLNRAATGVMVPKSALWSMGREFISTLKPSIKNAMAIRIPPPTTKGSMWDTPFISCV